MTDPNAVIYAFFKAWLPGTRDPLAGGLVYTYVTHTDTKIITYSDLDLTIPNTNPVILDSIGEAPIFYAGTIKMVLKDPNGVLMWTFDGISLVNSWGWHKIVFDWPGVVFDAVVFDGFIYP